MRIACYVNTLGSGGAQRVLSVLANGLSRRGHKVWMITDYSMPVEYSLDDSVERIIFDGSIDPNRKGKLIRTASRVIRIHRFCRREKADVLISFMREGNGRALLATLFTRTKNLISVRIDPKIGYRSRGAKLIAKFLYPLAEGCVFQTEDAQAWFAPKIQERSQIIFNPVSDTFFKTDPAPMAEKRIVSCGRLDKQKRFDLLIDAFHKVCDEFPEYKLEIYGDGKLEAELQAQIDHLDRQDRICLMGRCEDIPNNIKTASLFVLASDFEGLPNALMEAMALSLPVISTDCSGGGARALIEDGVDGRIVPCDDVDALAEAIYQSLADPETAKRRGEKAGEKAKGFSTENVIALWEDYIRHIVAG